jgi:uncharacterized protein
LVCFDGFWHIVYMAKPDYRTRLFSQLDELGAQAFDDLLHADALRRSTTVANSNPFVTWAWLQALEQSHSVGAKTGWQMAHLAVVDQADQVQALLPLYAKTHSYGEYVFDWAWADAYQRSGLDYYPKLLSAIPFTPVPGQRILARQDAAARALIEHLVEFAKDNRLSSAHVLFGLENEQQWFSEAGWLPRKTVQFHWQNPGWSHFDDYLASLTQPKRKKIKAERRKFDELGLSAQRLVGADILEADWDLFYRCYVNTYKAHHSTPYLTRSFFKLIHERMSQRCLMVKILRDGVPVATSLCLFDDQRLYGRYWGSLEALPYMHFEASYYQPIEFAIERQLKVFEGGAQGEHKMARGFLPVTTWSYHWLAQPQFLEAIDRYLQRESSAIDEYVDELNERAPFKSN